MSLRRATFRVFRGLVLAVAAGVAVLPAGIGASGAGAAVQVPASGPPASDTVVSVVGSDSTALRAPRGMVVSETLIASEVGREVLRAGGNAVDAAIATGFALAVTHPSAGNIGGGGFMVLRFPDGYATTIEFREKAPLAAHPEMFLDAQGEYSYDIHHESHVAVGVPGTVAGFWKAHQRYGSLDWDRLVDPAVRLADRGFPLSEDLAESLARVVREFERYPGTVEAFSRGGVPYEPGDTLRQRDLARTLARIRGGGRDGFYRGETARMLAEEMRRSGGLITEEDLARYEAMERQPIRGTFRGYEIVSMPPPSSGGVALVQMLNVLEGYDLDALEHNSPEYLHLLAETMRRAYRDRARWLADPDQMPVPVGELTSKAYAAELRSGIDPRQATPSEPTDAVLAPEGMETTHYSVVDGDGLAVSVTYTLEQGYGSGIVVPGAGFLLNNEMGDFNAAPGLTNDRGLIGTEPNLARPEQRMLSSMTPTIMARDGETVLVVGSPGGRTIINSVLQVVLNVAAFGMSVEDAVLAPRMHHQWLPDRITIEDRDVPEETVTRLEEMGHEVRVRGRQGRTHVILIDPLTGDRLGLPDPRNSDSGAAGY